MSAYTPLSHNRLLALENHIRGHQPRVKPARQRPLHQSVRRGRRPPKESPLAHALQELPTRKQRQEAPPQHVNKPLTQQWGVPPAPLQFRLNQPQARDQPERDARTNALPPHQPQPPQQPAGPYRKLAAILGQRHHVTPQPSSPKADIPTIPTPINPDIVATFSVTPTLDTIAQKQRRQTLNTLLDSSPSHSLAERTSKPTPPSTKIPKPKPAAPPTSYKSLATNIRQARTRHYTDPPEHAKPKAKGHALAIICARDAVFTPEVASPQEEHDRVIKPEVKETPNKQQLNATEPCTVIVYQTAMASASAKKTLNSVNHTLQHSAQLGFRSMATNMFVMTSAGQAEPNDQHERQDEAHPPDDIPASAATIEVISVPSPDTTEIEGEPISNTPPYKAISAPVSERAPGHIEALCAEVRPRNSRPINPRGYPHARNTKNPESIRCESAPGKFKSLRTNAT